MRKMFAKFMYWIKNLFSKPEDRIVEKIVETEEFKEYAKITKKRKDLIYYLRNKANRNEKKRHVTTKSFNHVRT